MPASIGSTVNIWQNLFSFPYLFLRVHVCMCWYHGHSLEISISFSLSSLKDPWLLHSCRSIVIRQQVSLRKYGRIHTGPSPLCKMSAQGQPADSYRPIAIRQQGSMRTAGHTQLYIVAVSLIGGGNRRTQRKPPTCRKSLTIVIT